MRYYEYRWTNKQIVNEAKDLACLPDKLEAELSLKVHIETLRHVRIFQDVEPGLLVDLVLKLKPEVRTYSDILG